MIKTAKKINIFCKENDFVFSRWCDIPVKREVQRRRQTQAGVWNYKNENVVLAQEKILNLLIGCPCFLKSFNFVETL